MSIDDGKEAAIRGLHAYKDELLNQIKLMEQNLHHVQRSIELLSSNIVPLPAKINIASPYSNLKNQAAAELLLKENPNRWFKASEVAKELLRRGAKKTSKNYTSIIANALNRAVDNKGLAVKEKRDGVWKYRWHKPEESLAE